MMEPLEQRGANAAGIPLAALVDRLKSNTIAALRLLYLEPPKEAGPEKNAAVTGCGKPSEK